MGQWMEGMKVAVKTPVETIFTLIVSYITHVYNLMILTVLVNSLSILVVILKLRMGQ
jgi:hypothetical protein